MGALASPRMHCNPTKETRHRMKREMAVRCTVRLYPVLSVVVVRSKSHTCEEIIFEQKRLHK